MNTLTDLIYLTSTNNSKRDLCLEFALPYSNDKKAETIIVPAEFIPAKIKYVEQAYNEKLVSKHNNKVKIIKFYLK